MLIIFIYAFISFRRRQLRFHAAFDVIDIDSALRRHFRYATLMPLTSRFSFDFFDMLIYADLFYASLFDADAAAPPRLLLRFASFILRNSLHLAPLPTSSQTSRCLFVTPRPAFVFCFMFCLSRFSPQRYAMRVFCALRHDILQRAAPMNITFMLLLVPEMTLMRLC